MKNKKLAGSPVAAILISGIGLVFTGCDKQGGPPPAAGGFAVPVTAVAAVARDVPVYIDEIGHTTASEVVTIQPQVSGKIIARHFADGADLKKGDLLFEIDPRPFQASLEQSLGQLAKDKALKVSAEWNVSQDTAALATKAISEQQLHNDTSTRDQAAAAIAVDQAAIDYAKLNVEYCKITSPINGKAGERLVDVGNVVTAAGQAPGTNLLSIQDLDPIYADFTVNEEQLAMVRQNMARGELKTLVMLPDETASIENMADSGGMAGPGMDMAAPATTRPDDLGSPAGPATQPVVKPHLGKLIFLDNSVQDATGTIKLRAELANPDHHFWPGQFVNVRLVLTTKHDAVLVPVQAVQISQLGPFVYVVDDKGTAQTHPVTQGQRHGDMVVIESGVEAGDSVVTTGQMLLQPGGKVMVVNAPHPGAGGGPPGGGNKTASNGGGSNGAGSSATEGKSL